MDAGTAVLWAGLVEIAAIVCAAMAFMLTSENNRVGGAFYIGLWLASSVAVLLLLAAAGAALSRS